MRETLNLGTHGPLANSCSKALKENYSKDFNQTWDGSAFIIGRMDICPESIMLTFGVNTNKGKGLGSHFL